MASSGVLKVVNLIDYSQSTDFPKESVERA